MGKPTIHPFTKSNTPIPSEVVSIISRNLFNNNSNGTLANLAATCHRAYDIAVPFVYRKVSLQTRTSASIFAGLRFQDTTEHGEEPPYLNAASHLRKMRALSHVETVQVLSLLPLSLLQEIATYFCLASETNDEGSALGSEGAKSHTTRVDLDGPLTAYTPPIALSPSAPLTDKSKLFSRCRYFEYRVETYAQDWRGEVYSPAASKLFCLILPHILDASTTHICLALPERVYMEDYCEDTPAGLAKHLAAVRYASVTLHGVCDALLDLHIQGPLRVFFSDWLCPEWTDSPCGQHYVSYEDRSLVMRTYLNQAQSRIDSLESGGQVEVEFIGAGILSSEDEGYGEVYDVEYGHELAR